MMQSMTMIEPSKLVSCVIIRAAHQGFDGPEESPTGWRCLDGRAPWPRQRLARPVSYMRYDARLCEISMPK
jgi:hypothetical protein